MAGRAARGPQKRNREPRSSSRGRKRSPSAPTPHTRCPKRVSASTATESEDNPRRVGVRRCISEAGREGGREGGREKEHTRTRSRVAADTRRGKMHRLFRNPRRDRRGGGGGEWGKETDGEREGGREGSREGGREEDNGEKRDNLKNVDTQRKLLKHSIFKRQTERKET